MSVQKILNTTYDVTVAVVTAPYRAGSALINKVKSVAFSILNTVAPRNLVTKNRQFKVIPSSWVNDLGAAYYNKLCPLHKISQDQSLNSEVAEVFAKLVAKCDNPGLKFEIRVMDDDKLVNAMCLPGGKIVITTALINKLKSSGVAPSELVGGEHIAFQDKLAAVLAHEIGHACAEHGTFKMQVKLCVVLTANVAQYALPVFLIKDRKATPVANKTPEEGEVKKTQENSRRATLEKEKMLAGQRKAVGTLAGLSVRFFGFFYAQAHSRCKELEADKVGIKYACLAGYKAAGAVWLQNMFMEMKNEKGQLKSTGFFARWFSTASDLIASHPPSLERLKANQETVGRLAKGESLQQVFA